MSSTLSSAESSRRVGEGGTRSVPGEGQSDRINTETVFLVAPARRFAYTHPHAVGVTATQPFLTFDESLP